MHSLARYGRMYSTSRSARQHRPTPQCSGGDQRGSDDGACSSNATAAPGPLCAPGALAVRRPDTQPESATTPAFQTQTLPRE